MILDVCQDFRSQLLLVDCDARTQAMLDKCLTRLGIDCLIVADDSWCDLDTIQGVIVELDDLNSERLLASVREQGLPIVAVTHHQTPSQIQRALRLGATAILNKPITQSAVYTTLMMARGLNERIHALEIARRDLTETLSQREIIAKAVAHLMVKLELSEQDAYEHLRRHAMSTQQPIEHVCRTLLEPSSLFAHQGRVKP